MRLMLETLLEWPGTFWPFSLSDTVPASVISLVHGSTGYLLLQDIDDPLLNKELLQSFVAFKDHLFDCACLIVAMRF